MNTKGHYVIEIWDIVGDLQKRRIKVCLCVHCGFLIGWREVRESGGFDRVHQTLSRCRGAMVRHLHFDHRDQLEMTPLRLGARSLGAPAAQPAARSPVDADRRPVDLMTSRHSAP